MNQEKKIAYVTKAALYNARQGTVRMHATMVVDGEDRELRTGISTGEPFTSSIIIHIDIAKRMVETANTIYMVVPEDMIETIKIMVPQPSVDTQRGVVDNSDDAIRVNDVQLKWGQTTHMLDQLNKILNSPQ